MNTTNTPRTEVTKTSFFGKLIAARQRQADRYVADMRRAARLD